MIQIIDFTHIARLKRIEKVYDDGQKILDECQETWNYYLDMETGDCIKLNILASQMESTRLIMKTLREEMNRINLELSN